MLNSTDLTTSILFIDAGVEGYEHLFANVSPSIQPHILNPYEDGIQQITNVLAGYASQSRTLNLYIVAHGSPGSISLGNTALSLSSLHLYQLQLRSWFAHRPAPSQLFLYACNAAAGDAGDELMGKLHQITGAVVHGSTTKVGNAALGGNWDLNAIAYSAQKRNPQSLAIASYAAPFSDATLESYAGVLVDTDGDLIDDEFDLDDDNDGIPDEVEGPEPTDSGQDGSYVLTTDAFGITGTVLDSIEIAGTVYTDLTTPDSYTSSFTNPPDPSEIYVINNGTTEADFGTSGDWDADAVTPFTSRDLNYYQGIDTGVSGTDFFELGYDVPVITTNGMFVAFTERNGNNSVTLQAFDANGNDLGPAINVGPANYVPMGIDVTYGTNQTQQLEVAIYPLDDLAPVGAEISSIRVTPIANGGDAADGKVFIFGNNTLRSSLDTDGDGIPNRIDLDSDNDGISDLVESGQNAAVIDRDNDGIRDDIAANPVGADGDRNGLADAVDGANAINVPDDFDTDGIPNYLDLDADNDGIPDVVEAQPTVGYTTNGTTNTDQDQDGVLDVFDVAGQIFGGQFVPPENTDDVDQPDYLDEDSDNDGENDIDESGLNLVGQDVNNDGIDDGVNASYLDPDGLVNVPLTNLQNADLDNRDADYRSLDAVPPITPPITPPVSPTPPVANDDTITAPAGTTVTINPLTNDNDPNGTLDPTTVVFTNTIPGSILSSDGKTLGVPGEGIWTIDSSTGLMSFTPVPGFTETPTAVRYTVRDEDGLISNTGTVSITYTTDPIVPPVAANDRLTLVAGSEAMIDPLANDSDADGDLDPATVTFVGLETPIPGSTLSANGKTLTVPNEGTWSIDPTSGEISFIPNAGFEGNPTPVQYTVNDDDGLTSNTATVRLTYTTVGRERINGSNSVLRSLSDPDAIEGTTSDDILNGGSQKDVIRGKGGDDVLNGGTNRDRLFGGKGNDLINGGSGNDRIQGDSGNDILNGGDGNDRMFGGRGQDMLTGSDGNDKLYGEQKKDTIIGGAGDDLIVGGRGRDTSTGGQGRDTFRYLSTKEFRDTITDFEILKDTFDLRKINTIGSMDDLNLRQKGDDAIVQGSTGQRFKTIATLESVDVNDLNESNFRF